jgi:hypothetical protein
MADGVIFTDIIKYLVGRLKTDLNSQGFNSTRVGVLADDSASQVILRADGGNRQSKTVQTDVVGVTVYAASYAAANTLSLMVMALFDDMPDGTPVTFTNPESTIQDNSDLSGDRRFMRFAVDHRGTNL